MSVHSTSPITQDKTYLVWFFALFLPLCLAVLVFKRTDIFPWIGACNANGLDQEHYLAYCHTTRFGDYEHYAFWHDTETTQTENLKNAEVLFLGNSRTQFAFSTQAVIDFFDNNEMSFFLLGFGLGGRSNIPESLIEKFELKPKAVIINADPFFSDIQDHTLTRAKSNSKSTAWEHKAKIFLQTKQQEICHSDNANSFLSAFFCRGEVETLFRSRDTGFWLTDYYRPDMSIPVSFDDSSSYRFEDSPSHTIDNRLSLLDSFIRKTGLPRECIILTVTPHTRTPLKFAKELSERANLTAYFPDVPDLRTIDESHLNKASAERWSAAFLTLAEADLRKCSEAETSTVGQLSQSHILF